MIGRTKVLDVDIAAPLQPLGSMDGYRRVRALVRLHGTPIGTVEFPLSDANLTARDLRRIVVRRMSWPIIRHHLRDMVERPLPVGGLDDEELLDVEHPLSDEPPQPITVAVCTRDRAQELRSCLDALLRLDHPQTEILVVDNAPSSDDTARLLESSYPQVRYVLEPRPGLDWARNRAIAEASGEIVAFTDDDVVVEPGWATAIAEAFGDPRVMAVTGLVVPYELETEAQVFFERYGGFGRGFERKYWRVDLERGERVWRYVGAGKYGTGANMAYRRRVFELIGDFDPALDVGTVTNGGGDLEMFFRVLKEGFTLLYEPAAIVRHRHRRDYAQLHTQIANNGVGFYSYLVRTFLAYPEARRDTAGFGLWWFWKWNLRRPLLSFFRPPRIPRDLMWAELRGSLVGLGRYPKARRRSIQIAGAPQTAPVPAREAVVQVEATTGVRTVDLCRPLRDLDDVADHADVRVFVTRDGQPIGSVDIANQHQPVNVGRLRDAIVDQLDIRLLGQDPAVDAQVSWDRVETAIRRRYLPPTDKAKALSIDVPVSIVVATHDRPDDLRECLRCLTQQESPRAVEVLVVDNHPASGLTPPVVAEFPTVKLVEERRQGLSYARNKGFTTSHGDIVIATDDDVLAPPGWLERIVAPFEQSDVAVVTGNTLPFGLDTDAQRHFEKYGGLGRGYAPKEADGEWFDRFRRRAVPTWELGATANAAFRSSIFAHPEIGLLDEALGAGTPTGCSEDTYLFYKVLKAGYTVAYEPSAYVWHKHRREMRSLRSQIYNYSKGHVAYHLTTLLRDRDTRALYDLTLRLPRWHLRRLASYTKRRLLRKSHDPLGLLFLEVRGNLAGPWSLWKSYQRVKREGRSSSYAPTSPRRDYAETPDHSSETTRP